MGKTDLTGRTAVVTGAGTGLGRAEALALAAQGADVVVNDLGDSADAVVAEIEATGRKAVAVKGDIGDWAMGERLVEAATETFGSLDIVVNNAGIVRDAMLFNMSEAQWDDVVRVHLKGHAALSRAACVHWRNLAKQTGAPVFGRMVNTTSEAFLLGGAGQSNYAAAKAGIVALTLGVVRGMERYGVRANAIAPRARTSMTEHVFADGPAPGGVDVLAPERVARFVGYLSSPAASEVNGQVFVVYGEMVALLAPPTVEHTFTAASGDFSLEELDAQVSAHFADRPQNRSFVAHEIAALDNTGVQARS